MKSNLFEKRHAPKILGELKYDYGQAMSYANIFNTSGMVVLLHEYAIKVFPWLNWPLTIIIFVAGFALLMIVVHVFGSYVDIDKSTNLLWSSGNKTKCYSELNRLYNEWMMLNNRAATPDEMLELQKLSGVYVFDKKEGRKQLWETMIDKGEKMAKYCPKHGYYFGSGMFCGVCGQPLKNYPKCKKCYEELIEPSEDYCSNCGTKRPAPDEEYRGKE